MHKNHSYVVDSNGNKSVFIPKQNPDNIVEQTNKNSKTYNRIERSETNIQTKEGYRIIGALKDKIIKDGCPIPPASGAIKRYEELGHVASYPALAENRVSQYTNGILDDAGIYKELN